jgi:hypothetical protein
MELDEERDAGKLALKAKRMETLTSSTTWYAACQSGHPFWAGPDRGSYDAAQGDASKHDDSRHGGKPNAVVLDN